MKFTIALTAVLFLPVLLVNTKSVTSVTSSVSTATMTSTVSQATSFSGPLIYVQAGQGDKSVYIPSNFTAPKGTNVTFYFPTSTSPHSVTQGSFDDPCVYLNDKDGAGFDSGLRSGEYFSIQITDDQKPIWFFCKSPGHCGLGMVGAINAPTTGDKTFEAYLAAAKAKAVG